MERGVREISRSWVGRAEQVEVSGLAGPGQGGVDEHVVRDRPACGSLGAGERGQEWTGRAVSGEHDRADLTRVGIDVQRLCGGGDPGRGVRWAAGGDPGRDDDAAHPDALGDVTPPRGLVRRPGDEHQGLLSCLLNHALYHRASLPHRPCRTLGTVDVRDELARQIIDKAIVRERVVLSSGREADYYVDLRRISLDGVAAPLVGDVMLDLVGDLEFDAVGGLTLGADPVADAMLHAAHARGRVLDAFVVRKDEKQHGLRRRIEGPDVAGRRVLAVEDTSTTGGSVLTAVEALREAGADVVAVAVIVDRDTGARERIEAEGLSYLAAYGPADLGL